MATTDPQYQALTEHCTQVTLSTVAASTTVPRGTLAVNDVGQIKKYTVGLMAAGAGFLGFCLEEASNATAGPVTASTPYKFRRGCPMLLSGQPGDAPTSNEIGKQVYLLDNYSVGKTLAASAVAVTLLALPNLENGNKYEVMLP